jgi:hypothetical protein
MGQTPNALRAKGVEEEEGLISYYRRNMEVKLQHNK